jgi:hypothetical protein
MSHTPTTSRRRTRDTSETGSVTRELERLRLEARHRQARSRARASNSNTDLVRWYQGNCGVNDDIWLVCGGAAGLLGVGDDEQATGSPSSNHTLVGRHAAPVPRRSLGRERPVDGPPPPRSWLRPGHVERGDAYRSTAREVAHALPDWLKREAVQTKKTVLTLQGPDAHADTMSLSAILGEARPTLAKDDPPSLVQLCIEKLAPALERCIEQVPNLHVYLKQQLLYCVTVEQYLNSTRAALIHQRLSADTLTMFLDQGYEALYVAGTDITLEILHYFLLGAALTDEDEDATLDGSTRDTSRSDTTALCNAESAMLELVPDSWEDTADDPVAHVYAYDAVMPGAPLLNTPRPPLDTQLRHLDLRGCTQLPPVDTAQALVSYVPLLRTLRLGGCFTTGNTVIAGPKDNVVVNLDAMKALRCLATGLIELQLLDLSYSAYISASAVRHLFGLTGVPVKETPSSTRPSSWPRLQFLILSGCPAVASLEVLGLCTSISADKLTRLHDRLPTALRSTLADRPWLRLVV